MPCDHPGFIADVQVNRLEDCGRFTAEVKIECDVCGKKMRFIGLPMGVDLNGATVSVDGTELRLGIHPAGEPVPGLRDDQPAGFRILNNSGHP